MAVDLLSYRRPQIGVLFWNKTGTLVPGLLYVDNRGSGGIAGPPSV